MPEQRTSGGPTERIRWFGDRILWKRGVTESGTFAHWALAMEHEARGWWPFAYTMLDEIGDAYQETDEPLLERLYQSMRAGDGVYKITRAGRFRDLDAWLAAWMQCRHDRGGRWFVHDMAASNGITSLELLDTLQSRFDLRVLASDWFTEIGIVTLPGSPWRVVFDAAQRPLQFVGDSMVLSAFRREPLRYPVNLILQAWLRRKVLPRARRTLEQAGDGSGAPGAQVRRVSLFHPLCVREAARNRRLELGRHSAFEPFAIPADIVRVMNFLTRRHLSASDFRKAAVAAMASVVEGGLLIQGRNVDERDGTLRATVFERRDGRLVPLHDIGGGSEERALLAEFALP